MKNPIQMIKQCVEKEEPYFLPVSYTHLRAHET